MHPPKNVESDLKYFVSNLIFSHSPYYNSPSLFADACMMLQVYMHLNEGQQKKGISCYVL